MSTFFVHKKRKFLYARLTIPKALRAYFGDRVEVWKSLKTTDKDEAACRSSQWVALGTRLFLSLRRNGRHMTKAQIEALVSNWLEAAFDEAEDDRATHGYISESVRENAYNGLSALFDGADEALTSGDYRTVATEADELLQAANFPALDHASPDFARLCRRLLRAKIEYARVEADRWEGEYKDDHGGRGRVEDKSEAAEAPSLPFSVVLDKYLAANPRPLRTATPLKAEFQRFMEAVGGDKPIATITKADGVQYKESLQLTRKLHPTTCMKHLSSADAFFRWAEVHGYVQANPMKGLNISKRQSKKAALRRRPFTDKELLTLFSSKEFLQQREERPERYWVVLLLLFQVCRREEAAQLYLKDLIEVEGIHCMMITNDEPDQTLKNEGSKRRVPLHSSLIQLGFLEYATQVKQAGQKRLFYQLDRKGNNGYADSVGKWFGRLTRDLGLTDPSLVIHSLRHGGITKLHSAGVPVNIVETLVGHSAGNVHEQYVHKELISMRTLRDGLEQLRYEGVPQALSHRDREEAA